MGYIDARRHNYIGNPSGVVTKKIRKGPKMERVYLTGTEDVVRSAHMIRGAADSMLAAGNGIGSALAEHQRFLNDWLIRFQQVVEMIDSRGEK